MKDQILIQFIKEEIMNYVDRTGTNCVKYSKKAIKSICSNEDAMPFWVADMDFQISEKTLDQFKSLTDKGVFGYPVFDNPKKIIKKWLLTRHNYDLEEDCFAISPGVLTSISIILEQIPGAVIVPRPAYKPFVDIPLNFDRKIVDWPLNYDEKTNRFSLNFETLEKLCKKEENKILIFCSPHNPTSLVFSEKELERITSICKKNDVKILCDEIHADLAYPNFKHTTINIAAKKCGADSIVFMAPSKTFNIAGEHFSITLFNSKEECQAFEKRLNQLHLSYPALSGGLLALYSYEYGKPWLDDLISTLQANASFIDKYFKNHIPEMKFIYPEASFITFIDCSELMPLVEKDAEDNKDLYDPEISPQGSLLSRFFGIRAKVAMNAGPWFGKDYEDFVRFNFGTSKQQIEIALKRMEEAVNQLKKKYQDL